jgi:DNA-binding transcriptional MerR regulator
VAGTFIFEKCEVKAMLIKELSKRTGVPRKTIRYYEQIGLLPPAVRTDNRYRFYSDVDIERLRFIKSARSLGFSLTEIAQVLAVRNRDEPPCSHVMDILRSHMDEIAHHIQELEDLRRDLMALYKDGQGLPEDVQMRTCVCHLIRLHVKEGETNGTAN